MGKKRRPEAQAKGQKEGTGSRRERPCVGRERLQEETEGFKDLKDLVLILFFTVLRKKREEEKRKRRSKRKKREGKGEEERKKGGEERSEWKKGE